MPFIAFLGCDGSGKSAVIQGLAAHLEAEGYQVTLGHWRPRPFAASASVSPPAADPHGQKARGFASSVLKLGWLWLNWRVAWARYLRQNSRSNFVLFDRYHGDLLVDPKRYRYGGPMWFARLASRFMPQPDAAIFLDAPPSVLLSRKQEVDEFSLERSRAGYLNICQTHGRFRVVDASLPLTEVVEEVINIAREINPNTPSRL